MAQHTSLYRLFLPLLYLLSLSSAYAFTQPSEFMEPADIKILRKAYPDIQFLSSYDFKLNDWKIAVSRMDSDTEEITTLYWADGKMLPADKLDNAERYWPVMYTYNKDIPDPADFTEAAIHDIRNFTSAENRSKQEGTSLDFFDALYDSSTRKSVEQHITQIQFLGKYTNVHEKLIAPLQRVEKRIRILAKSDKEVQNFIDNLARVDSYNWREIGDRSSRSFHSLGIAVDILPKGWGQKNIYWAWRRDIDSENWMLLPLERRWMPPKAVIQAFEAEGFIWGGKWIIWDNMHFEYHPELIDYNHLR
jgi:hypothetical protein